MTKEHSASCSQIPGSLSTRLCAAFGCRAVPWLCPFRGLEVQLASKFYFARVVCCSNLPKIVALHQTHAVDGGLRRT